MQRQIHAGGDAGAAADWAILHEYPVLLHFGARRQLLQPLQQGVVGGAVAAVQHPGLGRQQVAGADASDAVAARVQLAPQPAHDFARLGPRIGFDGMRGAADHHQRAIRQSPRQGRRAQQAQPQRGGNLRRRRHIMRAQRQAELSRDAKSVGRPGQIHQQEIGRQHEIDIKRHASPLPGASAPASARRTRSPPGQPIAAGRWPPAARSGARPAAGWTPARPPPAPAGERRHLPAGWRDSSRLHKP